jgi:bifunctional ADP-heptose synthase (sugar kinase/adenylyltransferase)
MHLDRFQEITANYPNLRMAVVGDFCLDRYLEIDPAKKEISIETNLPVHNVVNVRSQPGAAGTILNNLVALGIGGLFPVGFAGEDGEGYELLHALNKKKGVRLDHFLQTAQRRTFTYCKPLLVQHGKPPVG